MKNEEKNKVGRPKLADRDLKLNALVLSLIGLVFVLMLTIGGIFALTDIGSSNLRGAAVTKNTTKKNGNNSLSVYNINTNYFATSWKSTKGLKKLTVYSSNSNCTQGSKIQTIPPSGSMSSKNRKGSGWDFGNGTTAAGKIYADSFYYVKAEFKDKKNINICLKTQKGKDADVHTISTSNESNYSFKVSWSSTHDPNSLTVYNSDSKGSAKSEVDSFNPSGKKGSATIGDGGKLSGKIKPGKYYLVSIYFGKINGAKVVRNKLVKTTNSPITLTFKNVTDNSFEIHWKSEKGLSTFTTYASNSSCSTGQKIGSTHNPEKGQEKSGSWKVGQGGTESGYILKGNWYKVGAKDKNGTIVEKCVQVGKTTTKKPATTKKTTTKIKATTKKTTANSSSSFKVASDGKNCYIVYAPKNAKYWRVHVYYKAASAANFGSETKIASLSKNHYNDGVSSQRVCFSKQKFDKETFRILVKKTTGSNDTPSGSPRSWRPSGWNYNTKTGWAQKDYNVSW